MSRRGDVTELMLETFRLNGRLLAAGDALVADLGLTSARWQVLGAIALSPRPIPISHLARNMGLSRQAVQRLANEMAADGMIRFAANPHHRRARLVLLTDRGRELHTAAAARQGPWTEALAHGLGRGEVMAVTKVMKTLRSRLEASSQPDADDEG